MGFFRRRRGEEIQYHTFRISDLQLWINQLDNMFSGIKWNRIERCNVRRSAAQRAHETRIMRMAIYKNLSIMRNIAQHEMAGNRSNVDIQLNRHATPGLPGLGFPIHAFDAD
ncbi:hypothetical protein ACO22_02392 [Paracoccidioides brasiliensis]|uniref:Uncharacterized protein n=1 Tax=Paracoccidioides brasiliensis TaxID=121759 RepID=A0A1D2JIU7_PARBR|nr:hypothetical protein ACO22_02392 [Paracoccidioides brasiliensis]